MERSEIAQFGGLFAAAAAEPATEAPHRKTAPIAPGDSLLDILMGLDSVISKQRERQSAAEAESPAALPQPAERHRPPPLLQADVQRTAPLPAERARPPPLQAEPSLQAAPALQADWQAEIQQRHSVSQQALRVQALLRETGWQAVEPGPPTEANSGHTQPEEPEQQQESRCREGRQYSVPHGMVLTSEMGRNDSNMC